jgi:hypothetical protein
MNGFVIEITGVVVPFATATWLVVPETDVTVPLPPEPQAAAAAAKFPSASNWPHFPLVAVPDSVTMYLPFPEVPRI